MSERPDLLIVDDFPEFAEMLRVVGTRLGFAVRVAASAAEFRKRYAERVPGVVVMDLSLPDGDGLDLAHWLAVMGFAGRLILVSGRNPQQLRAKLAARELGGAIEVGVLSKPAALADIRAALSGRSSGDQRT